MTKARREKDGLSELEPEAAWRASDAADPDSWTLRLDAADHTELDEALAVAKRTSTHPLELGREDFPLEGLAAKLARLTGDILHGRGFVRISALDADRYCDEDLTLLYWGIGLQLGQPQAQNKHGHVLGDVTDEGKTMEDPTVRGNELGPVSLGYHSDGGDLVGLLCLHTARAGGRSFVASAVAIHNHLVRERPDLALALYDPLPIDARDEQPAGAPAFYSIPCFIRHRERLFVRFNPDYVLASQRHPDAPRLSAAAREGLATISALANDPQFHIAMDLQRGQMQFLNNYHVLHARAHYEDDAAGGHKRHLKRLWLTSHALTNRPIYFSALWRPDHWERNRSVSSPPPVARGPATS